MMGTPGGQLVLLGVFVCLAGIAISGKAGMMKEGELSKEAQKASVPEFSLVKGLIIAVLSGILSVHFLILGSKLESPWLRLLSLPDLIHFTRTM